jgi:hypothetical protein
MGKFMFASLLGLICCRDPSRETCVRARAPVCVCVCVCVCVVLRAQAYIAKLDAAVQLPVEAAALARVRGRGSTDMPCALLLSHCRVSRVTLAVAAQHMCTAVHHPQPQILPSTTMKHTHTHTRAHTHTHTHKHTHTQAHATAQQAAEALLQEQLLGRRQAGALGQQLAAQIAKERKAKETANIAESNAVCQALEMACSKQLAARVQVRVCGCRCVGAVHDVAPQHAAAAHRCSCSAAVPRRRRRQQVVGDVWCLLACCRCRPCTSLRAATTSACGTLR